MKKKTFVEQNNKCYKTESTTALENTKFNKHVH